MEPIPSTHNIDSFDSLPALANNTFGKYSMPFGLQMKRSVSQLVAVVMISPELFGLNTANRQKQEKPIKCAAKATDVLDNFLGVKHNANPLNILVHSHLL